VNGNGNAEQEVLVPLALIAIELGESVESVAHHFREVVRLDDAGMRAIPVEAARRFFTEQTQHRANLEEQSRRLQELEPQRLPAGIPFPQGADPTMSAYEVMRSVDGERERSDPNRRPTPFEEFMSRQVGPPRRVEVKDEPK
jgi:hypothetical protein